MDERELKEFLSNLDHEQRQVLYWRCRGIKDNAEIAKKIEYPDPAMGIGGGTVYNRLLWIYGRLAACRKNRT